MIFSVDGKRVTVAGAARSGLAAAELLARRGAAVTLSDTRTEVPGSDQSRASSFQRMVLRFCCKAWANTMRLNEP